jgi:hypothetical protein
MKTYHQIIRVVLCTGCALSVFTVPLSAAALGLDIPAPGNRSNREASVEGKVTSMSANSLSVSGKTIAITPSTIFVRLGQPATSADVHVGSMVKVTTRKAADGSLQAAAVELL